MKRGAGLPLAGCDRRDGAGPETNVQRSRAVRGGMGPACGGVEHSRRPRGRATSETCRSYTTGGGT